MIKIVVNPHWLVRRLFYFTEKVMKYLIFILSVISVFFAITFSADDALLKVELSGNWLIIWTPWNLNLGTVIPWNTIEVNFSDYFWIEDLRWTSTGHYTTIQCDGLFGPNGSTGTVITWVQMSWALVELVAWVANNTLVYSNLTSWTDITEPQLYFYRNENTTNPGWVNRYGNKPAIKISVPSDISSWNYKWKITYTLYDMAFNY